MKKISILFLLGLLTGCGYGMHYTKSVPPVPAEITHLKVAKIDEIKIVGRSGEITLQGKADFIRNFLVNEILSSGHFKMDDESIYELKVTINDYRSRYKKYISLNAQILDTSTNKVVWSGSISGLSKQIIDEVSKNTVKELVKDMAGKEK